MSTARLTSSRDPLQTARQWIEKLGGEQVRAQSWFATDFLAIGHFRFRPLDEEIEAPALPFHYVSLTVNGSLKIEANVGGRRVDVRIRSGQSMIMAANRENRWRWDGPTEETLVFLCPTFLNAVAEQTGAPLTEICDRFVFEDAHLRRTILGIGAELTTAGGPSPLFLDLAAQAVATRLLARHRAGNCSAGPTSLTALQLRRILSQVEDRLGRDIDLSTLADAAGVSRFHFLRCFRATTGMSPHQWVTQLRIERAKAMLTEGRMSVLEISSLVGFESQSHFGLVFRRHTGVSPREWRAQSGSRCRGIQSKNSNISRDVAPQRGNAPADLKNRTT